MANPGDKSDKEVREGTETLQNVADEIDQEGGLKRTTGGQEQTDTTDGEDSDDDSDDPDDKPVADTLKESPAGAFGRLGKGQQS